MSYATAMLCHERAMRGHAMHLPCICHARMGLCSSHMTETCIFTQVHHSFIFFQQVIALSTSFESKSEFAKSFAVSVGVSAAGMGASVEASTSFKR